MGYSLSQFEPVRPGKFRSRTVFLVMTILVPALLLAGVHRVLSAPLAIPNPPVINEPDVDGKIVSPSDVHIETAPMVDPDGSAHQCSDYQIVISDTMELVWETVCIGGVAKVHTHLGDGLFMGSYTGRSELEYETDYILRVRHIDATNEMSLWSIRYFTTGPATQIFPMEMDDILASPLPLWRDSGGSPIVLPAGSDQPFLRLTSPTGDILLQLSGLDGSSNQITNPTSLADHENVRVEIYAGDISGGLSFPESELTFYDHEGNFRAIFLPAIGLPAGQSLYYWVAGAGSTYVGSAGQTAPDFSNLARGAAVPWNVIQAGYEVEIVASGFQLPVHIAFVPEGVYPGNPGDPFYYVTELYGKIKVVTVDGTVSDYATDLLNFNPTGNFPGTGELGVTGVVVDPATGDVFASMLYNSVPFSDTAPLYPKVVRFSSVDGGLTAAGQTTVLDMVGESQAQSHQISKLTIGPDGKLYIHMGDGFDSSTALDLDSMRGKILRTNLDGSAPADNPFYDGGGGARDFIYAYGLRNPFGGAWRAADGNLYEVENGPSIDRFARVISGTSYGWEGTDNNMYISAIYNWDPAHAPVDLAFVQSGTFGGSEFPAGKYDHAFATESGPTWASGPQTLGKRIIEFVMDSSANLLGPPQTLIEYNGSGKGTAAGLAAGPDGLYFTDLYKDLNYVTPIDVGANILRIKYIGVAGLSATPTTGDLPLAVQFSDLSTAPNPTAWLWDFGDGNTSTEQNPTHVYTTAGTYSVQLEVTGPGGVVVSRKTDYITVNLVEAAVFSGTPTVGQLPLTVQFSDLSTVLNPTDWLWDFGDGITSTLQNPTHVYTAAGSYNVQLQVSGPGGVKNVQQTDYITVDEQVVALPVIMSAVPLGSDLSLAWGSDPAACDGYEIHRATTPDFYPSYASGSSTLVDPPGVLSSPTYTMTNVLGDSGVHNFFVIRSRCGIYYGDSLTLGEFEVSLVPGG